MPAQRDHAVASDEHLATLVAERTAGPCSLQTAHSACTELYQRHARRLATFLSRHVTPEDLEDIHQSVWSRVWQKLPGMFQDGSFRAWLFTVARNSIVDHSRKKICSVCQDLHTVPDVWAAPADELLAEEERMDRLRGCLHALDPLSREVMLGRLAGRSYAEICARTGLRSLEAHKLFHRAKRQVIRCMQCSASRSVAN